MSHGFTGDGGWLDLRDSRGDGLTRARLLIVDDDDTVRLMLRTLVRRVVPDLEVVAEARDGEDAIAKAEELHPDVVVIDHQMPGIDGLEAARRMLEANPALSIMLFTSDQGRLAEAARRLGIPSFAKTDVPGLASALRRVSGQLTDAARQR